MELQMDETTMEWKINNCAYGFIQQYAPSGLCIPPYKSCEGLGNITNERTAAWVDNLNQYKGTTLLYLIQSINSCTQEN